jgi:hypothetical protein
VTSSERDPLERSFNEAITTYKVAFCISQGAEGGACGVASAEGRVLEERLPERLASRQTVPLRTLREISSKRSNALASVLRRKLEETNQASESLRTSNKVFAAL